MIRNALDVIPFVTVKGILIPNESDKERLLLLMCRFAWACRRATTVLWKGFKSKEAYKSAYEVLKDYVYAESAIKHAKLILKGAEVNDGKPYRKQKRIYLISRGSKWEKHGNRNVKILRGNRFLRIRVKYPFDEKNKWIEGTADFGVFNPIIEELAMLAERNLDGYSVKITFSGNFYVHVSVPIELYLKYTKIGSVEGFRFAGFDVNSDRCNVVILDENGGIVCHKTAWFSQVVQHGYPKERAWNEIVSEVDKLFRIAKGYSVKTLFFEDLFVINGKRVVSGSNAKSRRKCSRFMKSKLLNWMILRGLKHGFDVYLVNPAKTSVAGEVIGKRLGLDKHTASAYATALRGINALKCLRMSI